MPDRNGFEGVDVSAEDMGTDDKGLKVKGRKEIEETELRNKFLLDKELGLKLVLMGLLLCFWGGGFGGFEEDERSVAMATKEKKQRWTFW